MLRSMYSGISGMKNFQTKLDVIGNNIANVNTYGFKKGRVIFKDLISQTTSGASSATATRGGINAKQVGLGSQIAAIDTIHGTGSLQTTSRVLDCAISGDGFFVVADYDSTGNAASTPFTNLQYTRAGNFYMDADGFLVNSDGKYLFGVSVNAANPTAPTYDKTAPGDYTNYTLAEDPTLNDPTNPLVTVGEDAAAVGTVSMIQIPTDAQEMSVGVDGKVTFVGSDGKLYFAGQLVMAKFANAGGLTKSGSNYYTESSNSGTPLYAAGTENGMGSVQSGFLEMSNVDLSEEFTEMIVAQRGFQANTRIITTSDEILQELVNLKR